MSDQDQNFRIRHTMLPVKSLDASIDFYSRLLGMTVIRRRFNEKRNETVAYVGYGEEPAFPSLELVEFNENPPKIEPGPGHIAIGVNDLNKLSAVLEGEGVQFRQKVTPNRPGSPDLTAFVLDPDGHELELTERH